MTIRESEYFILDSIKSSDMGVLSVSVSSGLYEEPYSANRQVVTTKIPGTERPLLHRVEEDVLEFPLTFYFEEGFDSDKARKLARWLFQDNYRPLQFSADLNRIYYVIFDGDAQLIHNGCKEGYITLHVVCNAPYAVTQDSLSPVYDLSSNTSDGTVIEIDNLGDYPINPEITILTTSTGDIRIINETNAGEEFKLTGLANAETIYYNGESDELTTDISGQYRYLNWNNTAVALVPYGKNRLRVYGNCKIQFKLYHKLR